MTKGLGGLVESFSVEHSFTETESRVATLLCEGWSNVNVARRMHRSLNTIHNHIKELLRKTETHSVREMLALVIEHVHEKLAG